jgi:GT2 family glycosyltransferase
MLPHHPQLFIIIIHYGSPKPTQQLLKRLLSAPVPELSRVILVDNSPQLFPHITLPRLQLLRPHQNLGYAAGINCGLGALFASGIASHDWVLIMNNDLRLTPHTLPRLLSWLKSRASITYLAGAEGWRLNYLTGRAAPTSTSPHYLDGSLLVAAGAVWARLKGLPEEYFLYWEDVALAHRARRLGLPLLAIPQLEVSNPGATRSLASSKLYYLVRNGAYFLRYHSPWPWPYYWLLVNTLREQYHSLAPTTPRRRLLRSALQDARLKKLGALI